MDPRIVDAAFGRRCDHRYDVKIVATIQVPLQDGGSAYIRAKATIENVSLMGLQVHIPKMNKEHCAMLVRAARQCSVICDLPPSREPACLRGKIAWAETNLDGPSPSARLGVHLTDTVYRDHYRLLHLIDKLMKETAGTSDRRSSGDRRQKDIPVAKERRSGKDRRSRRRAEKQIEHGLPSLEGKPLHR
jgi:hypothetical protein